MGGHYSQNEKTKKRRATDKLRAPTHNVGKQWARQSDVPRQATPNMRAQDHLLTLHSIPFPPASSKCASPHCLLPLFSFLEVAIFLLLALLPSSCCHRRLLGPPPWSQSASRAGSLRAVPQGTKHFALAPSLFKSETERGEIEIYPPIYNRRSDALASVGIILLPPCCSDGDAALVLGCGPDLFPLCKCDR